MTNYNLNQLDAQSTSKIGSTVDNIKDFWVYLRGSKMSLILAFVVIILNSMAGIITPYVIAVAVDKHIAKGDFGGVIVDVVQLGILFIVTAVCGFYQSRLMGEISQNTLLKLRQTLFSKIQSLPIAFFNQNRSGELMSRLNNDTDKLNQFLSESIIRFVGNFFVIFGIGIFILYLNFKLGVVTLVACVFLYIATRLMSPWIQTLNKHSLTAVADFESIVQENLSNFKVVAAFNRRDYFLKTLETKNQEVFQNSTKSEFAGALFRPIYDFAGNIAQALVLVAGVYMISKGELTVGFLIGFLAYTERFYDPLRILGTIWANIQSALAAWSRVRQILVLESDLTIEKDSEIEVKQTSNKPLKNL